MSRGFVLPSQISPPIAAASAVLQVLSTAKLDTYSASGAFADITGLTVTITPASASNKILILATINGQGGGAVLSGYKAKFAGGNSGTYIGAAAGTRERVAGVGPGGGGVAVNTGISLMYLDSPATTSAITYSVQAKGMATTDTVFINRSLDDTDGAPYFRSASSITVMEISA